MCVFRLMCKDTVITTSYISRDVGVRKVFKQQTTKVTFKGIYWQWCHLIGRKRFSVIFCCNFVFILHRFRDFITYLPNVRGHVTINTSLLRYSIMHALIFLNINQHTKFEVPSFIDYKDY